MERQTAINFDAPERPVVEHVDDPKLGYVKPMKWTRKQRRALESYRRTCDFSGPGKMLNGKPCV
jgi:hypothetical protein